MKIFLQLFLIFAKIGGFTFGGGLAMLPMLQKELVEKKHWVSEDELMDYYAIGQCTPGIIAVNTATFVGYKLKGVLGGIVATLGMVAPSIIIITIIAAFLQNFQDIVYVQYAFAGIRAAVVALILNTIIKLGKKSLTDIVTIIIFICVTALSLATNVSPAVFVIVAGVCGIILGGGKKGKEKAKEALAEDKTDEKNEKETFEGSGELTASEASKEDERNNSSDNANEKTNKKKEDK